VTCGFKKKLIKRALLVASWSLAIGWLMPLAAGAHCDSVDGPVVTAARLALAKGEVTPVLKWVTKDDEGEIRAVFQKTLRVRAKGPEAKELADRYFFETLVRMHRASEGEPYTGLKPAGAVEPIIQAADQALEKGAAEPLVQHLTGQVAKIEWHRGELFPRIGFVVTNSRLPGGKVIKVYNGRWDRW